MEERFGRYVLLERIAVGGMAEIFRAKAPGLGGFEKILAIKRLHPRYSQDEDFIKMLIDEARITVELSHSNIGQIFDLGSVDDHYFIAMEFIDGRDLYRVLRVLREKRGQMPLDVAAYIGHEACAGLDFAHRKKDGNGRPLNIVHRDVSPQNVLVSYDGEVKLVDFGIAKAALRAYETEAGIIKGKFYYMSPEQARGEVLDHRTDIFSIGIVLYESVTGELLYKDDDDVTLLSQVRRADIKPPSLIRPEIPDRLERIILRALSRDREDRYPSAQHMQRDLARFLRGFDANFNRSKLARFMGELYGSEVSTSIDSMGESDFLQAEDSAIGIASFDEAELTRTEGDLDSADVSVLELDSGMIEYVHDSESDMTVGPIDSVAEPSLQTLNEDVDSEDFFDDAPTVAFDKPSEEEASPPSVVIEQPKPARPKLISQPEMPAFSRPDDASEDAEFNEQPTSMLDEEEFARPHPAENIEPHSVPVEPDQSPLASAKRLGRAIHREWIYIGVILILVGVASALITRHFSDKDKPTRSKSSSSRSGGSEMSRKGQSDSGIRERSTGGFSQSETGGDRPQATVIRQRNGFREPEMAIADHQRAVLVIESTPTDARVEINGRPADGIRTPTRDHIPAGRSVRVRVFKPGYSDYSTEVILRGRETRRLPVKLEPLRGTLEIKAAPRGGRATRGPSFVANVYINDRAEGKTPRIVDNLKIPGEYEVRVTKDGFKPYVVTRNFKLEAHSQTKYVDAILEPIEIAPIVRQKRSRAKKKTKRRDAPRSTARAKKPKRRSSSRSGRSKRGGFGKLNVASKPWASVWVDERRARDTPLYEYRLSAGRHEVRVCFLGNQRNCQTQRVTIRANETKTLRFNGRR